MNYRNLTRNIYSVLIYRLLIIMILFSLARIGFFIYNRDLLSPATFSQFITMMRGGLLFDLSAVLYLNAFFILMSIVPFDIRYSGIWQTVIKYYYLIANGFALALNGADFVYFRFALKRATSEVFKSFGNEQNLGRLGFKFIIDYWQVTLFTLILISLMVYLYGRVRCEKPLPKRRFIYFGVNFALVFVVLGLMIGGMRGGFKHSTRPINISNAARFANTPDNVGIVLNTPFSIIRTSNKRVKTMPDYAFFDKNAVADIYTTLYMPDTTKKFKPMNVVVLILESFGKEYIGELNRDLDEGRYAGYTPFLDSIIREGLTFDVSIANGRKSIDAIPSILASVPSLGVPYIISPYSNNRINGIADLLRRKGYNTAFFHGAANGSMGFDSFTRIAGFERYFGLNEFNNREYYDGMWGIWDEPFLQFFADSLNSFKQPFLASVFTLSSHHPFKVPEQYTGKFKKGPSPILETIGYTDYALRKFFSRISDKSWFNNTLFVITADHANEPVHSEYSNDYGNYSVPIVFYAPGSTLHGERNVVAQQIDIMPTILRYLNYDNEFVAFGNDLFDDSYQHFVFNTANGNYHLYMGDYLLIMEGESVSAMYNYKTDKMLTKNILGTVPEIQKEMEIRVKAVMQVYSYRLKYNKMTPGADQLIAGQ